MNMPDKLGDTKSSTILQGTNLVVVLAVAVLGGGAFQTSADASVRTVEAIEAVRGDLSALRTELGRLQRTQDDFADAVATFEAQSDATDGRLRRLELELAAVRRCARTRKRSDCEGL